MKYFATVWSNYHSNHIDNATKKIPKSTKDLKDANKLRQLSDSELLLALRELVVSQDITFDVEGRYLKPDWQ
ncbi:MAG: hypothetical protein DSM106950_10475 [Stigonema ocellatum SAG 48.90 = DSM 106950]|nr:hypothetical protein [Stigonema ocellatum SAG 48.90 = DSM 106950]